MGEEVTTGDLLLAFTTIIGSLSASGGLWAFLQKRDTRKNAQTQLLLGLAHDRIIHLGLTYIERGSITKDEYEDLEKYLYNPYSTFGGNGLAEKVMAQVKLLPMTGPHKTRARIVKEHDDDSYSSRSQGSYAE
jgi:hypothetical protein